MRLPHVKVVCPECAELGVNSIVRRHPEETERKIRTFRDDQGLVHIHEPLFLPVRYLCSQGHDFTKDELFPCPTCGWSGRGAE